MFEQVTNSGRAEADTVSRFDSDGAIRRYQQIQQEIARLEEERERLRDLLVKELDGKFPSKWHSTIDGKPILVVHEYKTSVRYDEPLLRERLGTRYMDILEIDGAKIRKNRELVRPLLASVLDKIGTPAASRVEEAVKSGLVSVVDFQGAFRKVVTPYISIRADKPRSAPSAPDVPY
jgi:hypothetical protein